MAVEVSQAPINDTFWKSCLLDVKDGDKSIGQITTLSCVPSLIEILLTAALRFAGIVAVFFIIWGGIKYIRSGGDPKQAEGARQTITYAIIGLVIVLLAYIIISFVAQVTGLPCLKVFGFEQCQGATTAPSTVDENSYGCFYGTGADGNPIHGCRPYASDNTPSQPLHWYTTGTAQENQDACNVECASHTGNY